MSITPLPTNVPNTADPATFNGNMDDLLGALPTLVGEVNLESARINALGSGSFNATSTTSVLISTGSKSFTVQTGLGYVVGQQLMIAATASPTANYMVGQVTAYTSGTGALVVNVTDIKGSGTLAAWTISLTAIAATNILGTANTQTLSADLTLTTGSAGLQVLTNTVVGVCVWLPAATGYTQLGGPKFVIQNAGALPIGVRDNAGTLLGAIAGGKSVNIWLTANGTAAGSWTVEGDNWLPGLVTVDAVLSTTYTPANATDWNCWASLTNNLSLHAIGVTANGFAVVAVDSQGKTAGTPLVVESGASTTPYVMFTINSTQAIVFWKQSTNYRCAVLTVSGTTVTVGAVATQTTADWTDTGILTPCIAQLSTTLYVHCLGNSSTALQSTAISVSGTTCTIGTTLSTAVTANCTAAQTITVSSTTALVLYRKGTIAPFTNCARVISVSGTTCTAGTELVTTLTGTAGAHAVANAQLTSTTFILVDNMNVLTKIDAVALTVSGTTVTAGTKVTVDSGYTAGEFYCLGIGSSNTKYLRAVTRLSDTTALLLHRSDSFISRAQVLSISAGVVTYGTVLLNTGSNSTSSGAGYGTWLPSTTDGAIASVKTGTNATPTRKLIAHSISGTTINTGLGAPPSSGRIMEGYYNSSGVVLSSGDYLGRFQGSLGDALSPSPLYVFRNKNGAIQDRGFIEMPSFGHATYPAFGTDYWSWPNLINGTVALGYASGNTPGGAAQLRLVRVEVSTQ